MSQQYSGGKLMLDPNNSGCSIAKGKLVKLLLALFFIVFYTAANAQVVKLPETGQTICYVA